MRIRRGLSLLLALALAPEMAFAQQAEKKAATKVVKEMPAGWKMRLDRADAKSEEFEFWTMPPGWHMTTGPAGIVYDPSQTAKGEFRLESESFLFKPESEMKEGYGFFFGGKDLDTENQTYVYFLVRRDGQFLVKQRVGKTTSDLIPWTAHPAIAKHDGSDRTAKNILAVEVMKELVSFQVNGREVATLPRAKVAAEGIAGLRVNHHINVHVTYLNLISRGAR